MIDNRHIAPHFVFFEIGDKVRFIDCGQEKFGTIIAVGGDFNMWEGYAQIQTGEIGGGETGEDPITWVYNFIDLVKWLA